MKNEFKKAGNMIVFLIKSIMYILAFAAFYGPLAYYNWPLLNLSRTSVVTVISYFAVLQFFSSIYGGFDIGKRKTKPIIVSVMLAEVFTDIFAYIMLTVMNTNEKNNATFMFEQPWLIPLIIIVQWIIIFAFANFATYVYFKIYDPERVLIVTGSVQSLHEIMRAVSKFRLQYRINEIKRYDSKDLKESMSRNDTIFLYNIPTQVRADLTYYCYQNMKDVYINPDAIDIVEMSSDHVILDDISLLHFSSKGLTFEQRFFKRAMDIIISLFALIITSPLILVSAVMIKLEDGGPVIFKQNRVTKDGNIFSVYKLRTMKENSENISAYEGDDRVTRTGRFLRRFRIDELPQFVNVLRGEMSVVGPRPEMLVNIFNYSKDLPEFEYRLRVKAGITGYAQIAGKYNTSPKDKLSLDMMYIENYSFWMDIKLIFQTIGVLFKKDSTEAFSSDEILKFTQLYGELFENSKAED